MKINEVINEKERVDELAPLIPLGIAAGKAAAAAIAKHGIGTLVKGGIKKGAVADKVRQWTSKAPPDSSTPDALAKADVGYGTGQVDPPLAQAAKATSSKQVAPPKQVARPALPQGKMSPEAGAAIAQAQQAQRKRQRP